MIRFLLILQSTLMRLMEHAQTQYLIQKATFQNRPAHTLPEVHFLMQSNKSHALQTLLLYLQLVFQLLH